LSMTLFTNLHRPEKAAGMLDEKSSATILPLGQGWMALQPRGCNSAEILRESATRFKHIRSQFRVDW
jgi:hypothetical protein